MIDKTLNYKCYERDLIDKQKRNLDNHIAQALNFYHGKQYNNVNVNNDIRTTINICQMMVNNKASNIVGTPRFFTYMNDTGNFDCTKLERFDEYNRKKLNEDISDFESVKNGFIYGTEIFLYRWDIDDTTYKGIYKGGLVGEHIDPRRFAVSNPAERDVQNQKWVMFWKEEEIGAIREMVEGKNDKEIKEKQALIVPDDYTINKEAYDNNPEAMTYELVTVFTRFFRINGEVFFMCSTKGVDLFEYPHALNPRTNVNVAKKVQEIYNEHENDTTEFFIDYEMDFSDIVAQTTNRNDYSDKEYLEIKEKFSIYPFAVFSPLPKNNSFYGVSDVQNIIPIQKGINFAVSMNLKCIENATYNKTIVKEGALAGQQITNEPGQVITDYTKNVNGWGVKFEPTPQIPNNLLEQANNLIDITRKVYNFNDVLDGSISNQDISGYALQLMMKQSKTPLEQIQKMFWKFCKDKAIIRLMFYKHYVDKAKYIVENEEVKFENDLKAQERLIMQAERNGGALPGTGITSEELNVPFQRTVVREFDGKELQGIKFDVELNVDVMQGLVESKISEAQVWDTLVRNGGINAISPEMLELYMKANPAVSGRTKAILKQTVEQQKQSELFQTKAALQEATKQIEQLMQFVTQLQGQNSYQSSYIKNLTKEFSNKINVANKINQDQANIIGSLTKTPKTQGEVKSNNAMGIEGGSFTDIQ